MRGGRRGVQAAPGAAARRGSGGGLAGATAAVSATAAERSGAAVQQHPQAAARSGAPNHGHIAATLAHCRKKASHHGKGLGSGQSAPQGAAAGAPRRRPSRSATGCSSRHSACRGGWARARGGVLRCTAAVGAMPPLRRPVPCRPRCTRAPPHRGFHLALHLARGHLHLQRSLACLIAQLLDWITIRRIETNMSVRQSESARGGGARRAVAAAPERASGCRPACRRGAHAGAWASRRRWRAQLRPQAVIEVGRRLGRQVLQVFAPPVLCRHPPLCRRARADQHALHAEQVPAGAAGRSRAERARLSGKERWRRAVPQRASGSAPASPSLPRPPPHPAGLTRRWWCPRWW